MLYLNILFFIPSSKSQLLRFCSFSVPVNINLHTHKFCLQTAHGYRYSCYFHYYFISFGDYSLVSAIPYSLSYAALDLSHSFWLAIQSLLFLQINISFPSRKITLYLALLLTIRVVFVFVFVFYHVLLANMVLRKPVFLNGYFLFPLPLKQLGDRSCCSFYSCTTFSFFIFFSLFAPTFSSELSPCSFTISKNESFQLRVTDCKDNMIDNFNCTFNVTPSSRGLEPICLF